MTNDLIQTARGGLRAYLESRVKMDLTDLSVEGLWELADRGEQMEMAGQLLTGLANRELSTRVDSRKLSEELRLRGKTRSKFYLAIQAVEAFEALPDKMANAALAALGPTKVRALLSWNEHERAAFASGATVHGLTIDEAAELPTREFEKRARNVPPEVQRLLSENVRLKERLELSAKMAKDLSRLEANEAVPLFAREVREEAMFVSETMLISLQALEDTADASLFSEVKHAERLRWQPASARTLYHALATPVARALALMERAKAVMGDDSDTALVLDSQLEPSELKRFETMREALLQRLQAEKQDRDDERANTQPGRRGRRRGSKG